MNKRFFDILCLFCPAQTHLNMSDKQLRYDVTCQDGCVRAGKHMQETKTAGLGTRHSHMKRFQLRKAAEKEAGEW